MILDCLETFIIELFWSVEFHEKTKTISYYVTETLWYSYNMYVTMDFYQNHVYIENMHTEQKNKKLLKSSTFMDIKWSYLILSIYFMCHWNTTLSKILLIEHIIIPKCIDGTQLSWLQLSLHCGIPINKLGINGIPMTKLEYWSKFFLNGCSYELLRNNFSQ